MASLAVDERRKCDICPVECLHMNKRVLIVDDFPLDAELTRRVLEACKDIPEIVIVADGAEALSELERRHDYAVILLDLRLPKVDGFEVLKQLSSKAFLSDIPIIVVSGNRNDYDRMRVLVMGATDFVEKTIDYAQFRDELFRTLARNRLCCEDFVSPA